MTISQNRPPHIAAARITAAAAITGSNGTIASVTVAGTSDYTINRNQDYGIGWDNTECVVLITVEAADGVELFATYSVTDDNTIVARIYDEDGAETASAFSFLVLNFRR